MLRGNRGPLALPAIGFVALAIVGWGWWENPTCGDALKSLQGENAKGEETAYEGSVTCERDCQVTFGLAPNAQNEASHGAAEKNQTCDTAAELDLIQQMVMAHWAIVSALLAILGLIGVLYTFRETHKMGKLQSRAFIAVTDSKIVTLRDGQRFQGTIKVQNTGQTPAREMRVICTTSFVSIPTNRKLMQEATRPRASSPQIILGAGAHIVSHPTHDHVMTQALIDDMRAGRAAIVAIVKTDYVDVFGERQSDDFQLICYRESANEGGAFAGFSESMIT